MIRRWHFVSCLWLICLCSCHRGPGALASLSTTQIADRAKPATVLIVAEFEANGTIPSFTTDNARLAEDVRRQINPDDSDQQKVEKLFETFLAHPEQYLRQQGDGQRISTKIHVLGSGFIVTSDGYILTNAHVVKPDEEDLSKDVLNKISDQVDRDVKDVGEGIERLVPGETISDAGVARLRNALLQQYVKDADLHFDREVGVALSTENMGTDLNLRHCTVVKVGEPTPGKDVAVLKIDGNNLPTLPMAEGVETGSVRTGSDLVIMGYPGKVDVDENFTLASRLQPSMSYGHVSGIKEMSSGWYVIQTDATINPGNSGGPALNQYGQVVGQATFAETESQGLNFAIDIDVARESLRDLNIITGAHPTVKTALSSSSASSSSASSSRSERPRSFPLGMVFLLFVLVGAAIVIAIVVSRN